MSPEPLSAGQRWSRTAGWVFLGLFAVVYAHVCARQGNDFLAYYDASEQAWLRGDIYARGLRSQMHVPYVPIFTLVLAPLTLLGPYAAAWVWYALKVAALIFLIRWLRRAIQDQSPGTGSRAIAACVALPFLVAFNPFMGEFRLGQANLFVLLFSILTVRALERGRTLPAAFFFSLAVVKVTALALLPWFVLRRQWRFLGNLILVGAAWLAVLAAWWGPTRVPELFVTWVRSTAHRASLQEVAYFENQSLQGVAARLAGVLPALERPWFGLAAYQWLWIVPCTAVVLVLALSAGRDRFRARLPPEEFALASLLMLFASSDSRWAHHVQLLVPLAVLAVLAARVRLVETLPRIGGWFSAGAPAAPDPVDAAGRRLRRTLAGLLVAGIVILVLCGRDIVGPAMNRAVRSLSIPAAFDVALAVFLTRRLLFPAVLAGEARPISSLSGSGLPEIRPSGWRTGSPSA